MGRNRSGSVVEVTDSSEPTASDQASPMRHLPRRGLDLDAIEADLDAVQTALQRLADGLYWTDEVTGEPIPADVLAADPLARRA